SGEPRVERDQCRPEMAVSAANTASAISGRSGAKAVGRPTRYKQTAATAGLMSGRDGARLAPLGVASTSRSGGIAARAVLSGLPSGGAMAVPPGVRAELDHIAIM